MNVRLLACVTASISLGLATTVVASEPATAAAPAQPDWIWGPEATGSYRFVKKFSGPAVNAGLVASADDAVTLYLNGEKLGQTSAWNHPLTVNLTGRIRDGENELAAVATSAAGIAAFACRVDLVAADGTRRTIQTDETWSGFDTATPSRPVAAKIAVPAGKAPFSNVLAIAAPMAAMVPATDSARSLAWIWAAPPAAAASAATDQPKVVLERQFSLPKLPVSARVRLAATAPCDVIINGTSIKVLEDPKLPVAFEFSNKHLAAGDNTIRIEATSSGGSDAVVLSMILAEADGTRRRLVTDDSWQVVTTPDAPTQPAVVVEPYGTGARGDVLASLKPTVSPVSDITVPEGFRVELLHALDDHEGSWVAMCVDPKGRLIASDAGGGLVRITPPPVGGDPAATKLEPIDLDIGHANGLLWAFDSLYVMVCEEGVHVHGSGVYRVRDTNGDDVLDSVEFLRKVNGGGDHGPHALILSPDGKSITAVCGNSTRMTEMQHHQVPPVWKDDLALPKLTGHGFMLGAGGPAGYIARFTPDGKEWTLIGAGFRNQYDAAYNRAGELFTYDADMEWDLGMPWYRPTRVNHVVDGTEAGWRSVSGKWPEYYADSLPPVINVGRGSPTGVAFGYGAKFPAKWQEALYIADWTYGRLYAIHLKESGASYKAAMDVFLEGRGVKPTDIAVSPKDGAMYFCGGSRRSNSALYRVTYVGKESTAEAPPAGDPQAAALRALRHRLENAFHATDEASLALALENLAHEDRFIRFAARTLLEFRPVEAWRARALAMTQPRAVIQTALALARLEQADARDALYARLVAVDLGALDAETRLDAIRALEVVAARLGDPEGGRRAELLEKLHAAMPAADEQFNIETAQLLVRWKSPQVAKEIFPLFEKAGSQEEQMAFAAALRLVGDGWPAGGRERYFRWFLQDKFHKAGHLQKFIADIRKDAVASLSEAEKASLAPILDAKPEATIEPPLASRLFVRNWTTPELVTEVEPLLSSARDLDRGKKLYRETGCAACHLFKGEGGVTGPDLTLAANKFSTRELLEHVAEPSKVISDQYATTLVVLDDGTSLTGRLVNNDADTVQIQPNLYVPSDVRTFKRSEIDDLSTSPVSLMPLGLVNTCQPQEVADLVAFIQSGLKAAVSTAVTAVAAAPAPVAVAPAADNAPPPGFRSLFNGRDLAGWTENKQPPAHWTVKDGELLYDGKGTHLLTTEEFGDFVLLVDWKLPPRGNSGVLLRGGGTQVEINDADPADRPIWNGTTGGLYPDKPPTKRAAKPAGEWNHFEIRVEKGVITVLTNGEQTVDGFAKDWGKRAKGPIGFQHHGTPLAFKNIFVKPLDAAANKTDAVNATKPPPAETVRHFGIAPAGITSPELKATLEAMDAASVLPGQKHTITRMRWTDEAVPKLFYIGLWGAKVDDTLIARMVHTPDLVTVDLCEPHISDAAMTTLASLPKLRYLAIKPIERYVKPGFPPLMYCFPDLPPRTDRPRVTGKGLAALAAAKELEGLDLFDTVVGPADLAALAAIPKLAHLGLPLVVDDEALGHLRACKRLHGLTLGSRDVSAEEIARLASWPNLRKLTLIHATLSDAALEAIARLATVQQLELVDCGLTDARLAHLKLPPKLTQLNLRQNDLAGPGLKHLVGTGVKTLNLMYTDLDDETIRHLPQLVSVTELDLQHCPKITDAGIRSGVLQGMKQLERLNFRDQKRITDACLDDLAKFGHLQSLGVRAVGITTAGVERLKREMPDTFVFR